MPSTKQEIVTVLISVKETFQSVYHMTRDKNIRIAIEMDHDKVNDLISKLIYEIDNEETGALSCEEPTDGDPI